MQESTLFKTALITSLVGLFIMILIVEKIDLSSSNISSISKESIGKRVKIKGIIDSKRDLPNILILNLTDNTNSIKVIAYKDDKDYLDLRKDGIIEVIGLVKEYNKELEIEADLIKRL